MKINDLNRNFCKHCQQNLELLEIHWKYAYICNIYKYIFENMKNLSKKQAYEFLSQLAPGTHEIKFEGTTRGTCEIVAAEYNEKYAKTHPNEPFPIQITSHSSGLGNMMEVHVREHERVELTFRVYGSNRDLFMSILAIPSGYSDAIKCDADMVQKIRMFCAKQRGYSVRKTDDGCVVYRDTMKPKSMAVRIIEASKEALTNCTNVHLECARSQVQYVRSVVSNNRLGVLVSNADNGVTISPPKNGYLFVSAPHLEAMMRGDYQDTLEFRNALKNELQSVLTTFDGLTGNKHRPAK